jgi:hypothetical protein
VQISSVFLKQKPCRAWLTEHADPADTILYVNSQELHPMGEFSQVA